MGDTYPVATLKINGRVSKFFCDAQGCKPIDVSLPTHAEAAGSDNETYVWEYVSACTSKNQPCVTQHDPSVLLRRCPPGTELVNKTLSGTFNPTLQECSSCGNGKYIIDPMHGE